MTDPQPDTADAPAVKPIASSAAEQAPATRPVITRTWHFNLTVVLSALVMLLLPLTYIALVGFVGWLTLQWFLAVVETIWTIVPGLVGLIVLIFMIRPLFFLVRGEKDEPIVLDAKHESLLYQHVARISDAIGAPKPSQIEVDLQVNASAAFGTGLRGLFTNQLRLTIGLPLIAGMSVQQMSGVIAHELGHFTQRSSLRAIQIIRVVNSWLMSVLEYDHRDYQLKILSEQGVAPLRVVCYVARFVIWVIRRVLWLFTLAGHMATCFVLRQCEFDADQYETYVEGSNCFGSTSGALVLLSAASAMAKDDLISAWTDRRLGDNLPALIASRARRLPKERRSKLLRLALNDTGHLFDTHPTMVARINAARQQASQGLVRDRRPARILFNAFPAICKRATMNVYRDVFGKQLNDAELISTDQLVKEQAEIVEAYRALNRFFQGDFLFIRPQFPKPTPQKLTNASGLLDDLKKSRKGMLWASQHAGDAVHRYDKCDTKLILAKQALALVHAEVSIDPESFDVPSANRHHIIQAMERVNSRLKSIDAELSDFDQFAQTRLTRALQLMQDDRVLKRMPAETRDEDKKRVEQLLAICEPLQKISKIIADIRNSVFTLKALLDHFGENYARSWIVTRILEESNRLTISIGDVHGCGRETRYPFDHADGRISIARYLVPKQPDPEDPIEVLNVATELLDQYDSLLSRLLAHLVNTAEKVETAIGFKPLSDPKVDDPLDDLLEEQQRTIEASQGFWAKATAAYPWAVQIVTTFLMLGVVVAGIYACGLLISFTRSDISLPTVARGTDQPTDPPDRNSQATGTEKRSRVNSRDVSRQRRNSASSRTRDEEIDTVAEAMAALTSRSSTDKSQAIEFFLRTTPSEKRDEVTHAMLMALDEFPTSKTSRLLQALEQWSPDDCVEILSQRLEATRSSSIRTEIMEYLVDKKTEPAIQAIARRLTSRKDAYKAKQYLKEIGRAAEPTVGMYLQHTSADVRAAAIEILEEIGSEESVPDLVALLDDRETTVVYRAESALQRLAPREVDTVAKIVRGLASEDPKKQQSAIQRLGSVEHDPRLEGIAMKIMPFLESPSDSVRRQVQYVLLKWVTPECVPGLLEALPKAADSSEQQRIVKCLAATKDVRAVPAIFSTVKWNSLGASQMLIAIGPEAEPEVLTALKKTRDDSVRKVALRALSEIGTKASIPTLMRLSRANDRTLSSSAKRVMQAIRSRY